MKMHFSTALNEMICGYCIARKSWNDLRFIKKTRDTILEIDLESNTCGEWIPSSTDILADDWFTIID